MLAKCSSNQGFISNSSVLHNIYFCTGDNDEANNPLLLLHSNRYLNSQIKIASTAPQDLSPAPSGTPNPHTPHPVSQALSNQKQ